LAILLAVRLAYLGTWAGEANLLRLIIPYLPDSSVRDRLMEVDELGREVTLENAAMRFGSSGYVVESVPLALMGAQRITELGFEELLESIVRAGGDTDTIASMQWPGRCTMHGKTGLPTDLVRRLPNKERIISIAETFANTVMELSS